MKQKIGKLKKSLQSNGKKMLFISLIGISLGLMIPGEVLGAAPSTYVNNASNTVKGELKSVAGNLLIVVFIALLIAYPFASQHAKGNLKKGMWLSAGIYVAIGVVEPLLTWAKGIIN